MKEARIRVPATTANMGPGFDCLGAALSLYGRFTCSLQKTVEISGCPVEYQNESNLFILAYRRMSETLGIPWSGLKVHIDSDVPVSRGLGSSATLLAAGATACYALNDLPLDKQAVLNVCNAMEGHPDNVAPCVLGGMRISMVKNGVPTSIEVPVSENIGIIALIPNIQVSTQQARAVLPPSYSRADAVFNISRLGVLLRAFELGNLNLIGSAMEDCIHQPYRQGLIHHYNLAKEATLGAGAKAFCISGSGSTCLAVCAADAAETIAQNVQRQLQGFSESWQILPLKFDREGAHAE